MSNSNNDNLENSKNLENRHFVGVDLGGTNINAGVVDRWGNVISRLSLATQADKGPEVVIDRIAGAVLEAISQAQLDKQQIAAVGIGSPGMMSHKKGLILSTPNLPGWHNVPLAEKVSKKTSIPAMLENDANAAAWAEFWIGAGRDYQSLAIFTLGTGIGGGIIQDGSILRGAYENAAELGHMIVQPDGRICNCGQRGCLEAYASASNTAKIAIEAVKSGKQSSLKDALDAGETITSRTVVQHMQNGDKLAGDIWQQTCRYLAIGCINIAHIINCQIIVLSGGMAGAGDQLLKPVQKYYQQLRWNIDSQMQTYPPIVLAELGSDAGLIGAAGAAMLHLKKTT